MKYHQKGETDMKEEIKMAIIQQMAPYLDQTLLNKLRITVRKIRIYRPIVLCQRHLIHQTLTLVIMCLLIPQVADFRYHYSLS